MMSTRDCVCFQDFCAEIEVLQDEVAQLREVLEGIMQWNNKLVLALPPEALPALAAARAALKQSELKP
jgi:hypothetical protein